MRLPRVIHRAWAWFAMYFWKPCPLCGKEFGGHEWRDIDGNVAITQEPGTPAGSGRAICPDCTRAGRGDGIDINEVLP